MQVASFRNFSRLFTRSVGALDEQFLGRSRPLGEARLLYEIGRGSATVAELRARLGLDSGYTSRLLRRLERDGLVATTPDAEDRRRRQVQLTAAGRAEWEALERLSNEQAESILAPLGDRRSDELAMLLTRAQRLLEAATATIEQVDAGSANAQRAVASYFAELDERFPGGFDPGDVVADETDAYNARDGAFVVVRCGLATVGCGGLLTIAPRVGEIKRMWINASHRRLGLAGRLLADLERRSAALGHHTVRLDTNGVLTDAIAMYRETGYTPIERYNDNPYAQHWFEKRLS